MTTGAIGQNPELESLAGSALVEPNEAKRFEMIAKVLQLGMDTYVYPVIGSVPAIAALGPRLDMDFPVGALSIPRYIEYAKHRK